MLVLSRKKGESIMISDEIELKILSIDGDQVKLGIVAPKTVKVHRAEVHDAIKQQNQAALATTSLDALQNLKKNF